MCSHVCTSGKKARASSACVGPAVLGVLRPSERKEARLDSVCTRSLSALETAALVVGRAALLDQADVLDDGGAQPSSVRNVFRVLTQPPGQSTRSTPQALMAQSSISSAERRTSTARCVMPARAYSRICSAWSPAPVLGRAWRSLRSCIRTPLLPSKIRGSSLGRRMPRDWGRGESGEDVMVVVRWARDSLRWASEREERRDRWCENFDEAAGALVRRDCSFMVIDFELKLVSVKLEGLGFALPTLSFAFWSSDKYVHEI